MFVQSIIFELLGDGDLSVDYSLKIEGFFMQRKNIHLLGKFDHNNLLITGTTFYEQMKWNK